MMDINVGELYFNEIYFNYNNNKSIYINPISVRFVKGKINVVTGENGCGKTTLLSLSLGIWDNYSGEIFIGSSNITGMDKKILREIVGFSFQDAAIFYDTILNIITMGKNVENEYIEFLFNNMHFFEDEFLLNEKMETIVSSKNLSQGQKQKLSICRLLYSRKPIMIFDEPTSNLDGTTTNSFINLLKQIKNDYLIIVITHDIRLIQVADYIYKMI